MAPQASLLPTDPSSLPRSFVPVLSVPSAWFPRTRHSPWVRTFLPDAGVPASAERQGSAGPGDRRHQGHPARFLAPLLRRHGSQGITHVAV